MCRYLSILAALIIGAFEVYGGVEVVDTVKYQPEGTDRTVFSAKIDLPSAGRWIAERGEGDAFIYLSAPGEIRKRYEGRRVEQLRRDRKKMSHSYRVRGIVYGCRQYALTNNNIGPATVEDIETNGFYIGSSSYYKADSGTDGGAGHPVAFLIPNVPFRFTGENNQVFSSDKELLAIELEPYLDDGKHWAAYTDGSCEYIEIDQDLLKKYNLVITPVTKKDPAAPAVPDQLTYEMSASISGSADSVSVNLRNVMTDDTISVEWDISQAGKGDVSIVKELDKKRSRSWLTYARVSDGSVLHSWLKKYGVDADDFGRRGRRRQRGRGTSVFGIMGGRAAVRETLQMQVIGTGGDGQDRTIPVDTIPGVKVKSHPFKEMLAGKEGGRVPVANIVPADHLFLNIVKPESMLAMLDDGAEFMSRMGGSFTDSSIAYNLKERYLKKMGLDEKWLRMFLKSGIVKECALIAPDMFFIDGTEITAIARISNMSLVSPMLSLVGVNGLTDSELVRSSVGKDRYAYWTTIGDLLVVGTSRDSVAQIINLQKNDGEGSLGKSDEFRYMLTQLPLTEKTRSYVYISDPFIRNLVSPKVKIAQLRRMIARGHMEKITAGALLAKLEDFTELSSVEALCKAGYVSEDVLARGYTLDEDLTVHSKEYGTLADMASLNSLKVDLVTERESTDYKRYLDQYNRFWRGFFDPIAIRLDDTDDKALEATVFILPLIDSSLYNGLKEFMMRREDGRAMTVPQISPAPVMMLSVNIKESAWSEFGGETAIGLQRAANISPAILDDLGPGIHLAINDGDPVVALGSGDLMGAFAGRSSGIFGNGTEMLMVPAVLSVLTRPCTLAIETRNPEATLKYLRMSSTVSSGMRDELQVSFHKIADEDRWVCTVNIMGMVKLRYGFEVKENFLVIRNIPWAAKDSILSSQAASLNGARLSVNPSSCREQLAGLHASAVELQSSIAAQGAGMIYPLLESGYCSIENASACHMKLFGFMPMHPSGGAWSWKKHHVVSSEYGSVYSRELPGYEDGDRDFGLMKEIDEMNVQMQFEDTGLRTKIRWKLTQP